MLACPHLTVKVKFSVVMFVVAVLVATVTVVLVLCVPVKQHVLQSWDEGGEQQVDSSQVTAEQTGGV